MLILDWLNAPDRSVGARDAEAIVQSTALWEPTARRDVPASYRPTHHSVISMKSTVFVSILALMSVEGCYNTARDGSRPSPACMEADKLIVENNTDEPVEMFWDRATLGMARRGRTSIQLPPNVASNSRFSALGVSGKYWKVVSGSTPAAGKVWVATECPKG